MKKLFKAIRSNDFQLVKELIESKPELVNCTAKQPPKKDDGQAPLQVALKIGAFDIADYLIDQGANLNFIEDVSCCNEWRAPVLHDAINAAVMSTRWNCNNKLVGFRIFSTEEKAKRAYSTLEKMLRSGSDVNKLDSYGNSGIWCFCNHAAQIVPTYNYVTQSESDDRIFTEELESDLGNILNLLCKYGADLSYIRPDMDCTVKEHYTGGTMAKLLNRV